MLPLLTSPSENSSSLIVALTIMQKVFLLTFQTYQEIARIYFYFHQGNNNFEKKTSNEIQLNYHRKKKNVQYGVLLYKVYLISRDSDQ